MTVPTMLATRRQWVLWRAERGTKVPYTAGGRAASSTDAKTWLDLDAARKLYKRGGYSGIGYVFSGDDGLVGVDLDDCRDPESGEIAPWALDILRRLNTYCEVSPSGTGVKAWAIGSIDRALKTAQVEVYARARYFAFTGQRLDGYPDEPQPAQEGIDYVIAAHAPPPRPEPAARPLATAPAGRRESYAQAALRAECERVEQAGEGNRNNTLNAAAFSLGQLVAGGLLSEDEAADSLTDAALRAGLAPREIIQTIRSGMRAGAQNPRAMPVDRPMERPRPLGGAQQRQAVPVEDDYDPSDGLPLLLHARDLGKIPQSTPLIPDMIYVNRLHQIFGAPGSGKSYSALDIACTVAQRYPVIYVAAEAVEDYEVRKAAWEARHRVEATHLYFWRVPLLLSSAEAVERFIAAARAVGPALIIIDPLADCMAGLVESTQEGMGAAIYALNQIRRATRAGILIIHHTGWNDERERGSSVLRGACRVVIKVEQRDDGLITISCVKKNQGKPFPSRAFRLVESADDLVPLPAARVLTSSKKITERMQRVMEALTTEPLRDGANHSDLVKDTAYSAATLNRVLTSLVEGGYVNADDAGRSRIYKLSVSGLSALQEVHESAANGGDPKGGSSTVLPHGSFNWFVCSSIEAPHQGAVLPSSSTVLPSEVLPSSILPHLYGVEWKEELGRKTEDDELFADTPDTATTYSLEGVKVDGGGEEWRIYRDADDAIIERHPSRDAALASLARLEGYDHAAD